MTMTIAIYISRLASRCVAISAIAVMSAVSNADTIRMVPSVRIASGKEITLADLADLDGADAESLATTLADARESLEAFNRVAVTLRGFINSQQGLGESTSQALSRLAEAAAAVERLADFLERNPGSLLSGRRPPP